RLRRKLIRAEMWIENFFLSIAMPFGQGHDASGDGFHDALRLALVMVPVVNVGNAAFAAVFGSGHGGGARAERGGGPAVGAPKIVRRRPLDAERGADRPHGVVEANDWNATRTGKDKAGVAVADQLAHWWLAATPGGCRRSWCRASPRSAPARRALSTS